MRPMGHIVDLYISGILNSSVSRNITKGVGGGGRTGHVFKDIFRNVNMPLMATPTHTSCMNSTGFFFQCMYTVCFLQGMVRISQGTVRCFFFRTVDGLIKIVAWFVNVCMLILNEVDVTHRPYRFFFHYHFLKL